MPVARLKPLLMKTIKMIRMFYYVNIAKIKTIDISEQVKRN